MMKCSISWLLMSIYWLWYCTTALQDITIEENWLHGISVYLLQVHVNHQLSQNKKFNLKIAHHRLGKNICKIHICQKTCIQNIFLNFKAKKNKTKVQ